MPDSTLSFRAVPLSEEHVPLCAALWGDRLAAADATFGATLRKVAILLRRRLARGALLVDQHGTPRHFGLTVFATESFANDFARHPHPRLGARLLRDWSPRTKGHVLDERDIARGNRANGVALVVIGVGWDLRGADAGAWPSLFACVIKEFIDVHRGFRLSQIAGEAFGADGVEIVRTSNSFAQHHVFTATSRAGAELKSVVYTMTREQAQTRFSALMPMFAYTPPRLFLTEPERRLVGAALSGGTDEALAHQLGISTAAVKARWTRIQRRAAAATPGLVGDPQARQSGRGAQKRHLLLEYVRANPSELTPYLVRGAVARAPSQRRA